MRARAGLAADSPTELERTPEAETDSSAGRAATSTPTAPLTPEQRSEVAQHVDLLHRMARRFCSPADAADYDDLVQAGAFGLMRAVQGYCAERGTLRSYAATSIAWAMRAYLADFKHGFKNGQRRRPATISLDATLVEREDGPSSGLIGRIADECAVDAEASLARSGTLHRAVAQLDGRLRQVVDAVLEGEEDTAIGGRLAVSGVHAGELRRQAVTRMQRFLRKDGLLPPKCASAYAGDDAGDEAPGATLLRGENAILLELRRLGLDVTAYWLRSWVRRGCLPAAPLVRVQGRLAADRERLADWAEQLLTDESVNEGREERGRTSPLARARARRRSADPIPAV